MAVGNTVGDLDTWRAAAVGQWTDSRIVDSTWIDAVLWFFLHSYADLAQIGAEVRGFSFRLDKEECLLVLKILREGIPEVVFLSSVTPTRCMQKLRRRLREGDVKFFVDKYA